MYTNMRKRQGHKHIKAHYTPTSSLIWLTFLDPLHAYNNQIQVYPLPPTPNFGTLIIPGKTKVIKSIKVPVSSEIQVIVYLNGSRIEEKNTAAAAWFTNNKHFVTHQLGKGVKYGIFEAKFVGLVQALKLAKRSHRAKTRQITIVLDNQGVVRDMSTKKATSRALTYKIEATTIITKIKRMAPHTNITLRWCPGHQGLKGNKEATCWRRQRQKASAQTPH